MYRTLLLLTAWAAMATMAAAQDDAPAKKPTEAPKKAAPKDAKAKAAKKDEKKAEKFAGPKGTPFTVTKVDLAGRTVTLKGKDGGTVNAKIASSAKFIGPRGGVSADGIKDDRFVAGAEIHAVIDSAKSITEVHLPYRKSEAKGEKKASAKDAKAKVKDAKDAKAKEAKPKA